MAFRVILFDFIDIGNTSITIANRVRLSLFSLINAFIVITFCSSKYFLIQTILLEFIDLNNLLKRITLNWIAQPVKLEWTWRRTRRRLFVAKVSMSDQDMLTSVTLEKVPMEWSGKTYLIVLLLIFPVRAKNSCIDEIYLRCRFRT